MVSHSPGVGARKKQKSGISIIKELNPLNTPINTNGIADKIVTAICTVFLYFDLSAITPQMSEANITTAEPQDIRMPISVFV